MSFRIGLSILGCTLSSLTFANTPAVNHLPDNLAGLPQTIDKALAQFHTPGMSVGIIKDGETVYLAGHGMRDLANQLPVEPDTWFRLASTSKAFTATTVAQLVDEQKLTWHTKVTEVLPAFQMADPWVTREMDITDLLTHRSGLSSGAGDSMLWPEPSGFSRDEIIHNLRYLTPAYSFRRHYAYSNVMYITAGELVAKVTEQPWESRVQESVFAPLKMQCFGGDVPDTVLDNRALSYGYNDERGIYPIPRNQIERKGIVSAAAGGVTCNAPSMLSWLQMWLDGGKLPSGEPLLQPDTVKTMLTPQTILSVTDTDAQWDNMHFKAYGLGWRLMDIDGQEVISHTGTLSGYQTYVAFIPDLQLGVVILNNGSNSGARGSVMETILKAYIPDAPQEDWVDTYQQYRDERAANYRARHQAPKGSGTTSLAPESYLGTYEDKWFGTFTLSAKGQSVRIVSAKMPTLQGTLEPFDSHTFMIRWDNQNAASDAFIRFDTNPLVQVTGFSLSPYTVRESTQHEWRDMYFTKVSTPAPAAK
ncbi:serine hydrolase [Alteromonas sp. C1M14]|nr:serine hydrolase [Alteromonas sp. C1M14]